MAHHDEYQHWPFVTLEEFELACHFFERSYIQAKLGPSRRSFKVNLRRVATTGDTYMEILRLLQPPEDEDELSLALSKLGTGEDYSAGIEAETSMVDEDEDRV
jgi:ubiquitin-like-conjugating enzyme ATG10